MIDDEMKEYGAKLAQHIIEELESYNLDFVFNKPTVTASWSFNYLQINLFGTVLPDDVEKTDEEVLSKFIKQISNDFVKPYGGKVTRCICDMYPREKYKVYFDITVVDLFKSN